MLNKHERPLNKTERRCLVYMLETVPGLVTKLGTIRWFSLWTGILFLCIFLFAIGLFRAGGPSGVWLAVLPVVVIFGILAFYSAYMVVSSYIHLSRFSTKPQGFEPHWRTEELQCAALRLTELFSSKHLRTRIPYTFLILVTAHHSSSEGRTILRKTMRNHGRHTNSRLFAPC